MSDFIEKTLGAWMDEMAQRYHDHEAMVYVDRGIRLTYSQLNDVARQAAKSLLALGVKRVRMSLYGQIIIPSGSICCLQLQKSARFWLR